MREEIRRDETYVPALPKTSQSTPNHPTEFQHVLFHLLSPTRHNISSRHDMLYAKAEIMSLHYPRPCTTIADMTFHAPACTLKIDASLHRSAAFAL